MTKTAITALQEYLQKDGQPLPVYTLVEQNAGTHINSFTMQVSCGSYHADATASTKKGAKHNAASNMIKLLRENHHVINYREISTTPPVTPQRESSQSNVLLQNVQQGAKLNGLCVSPSIGSSVINSIGKLQELCMKYKLKLPVYEECPIGFGHGFKICCTLGNLKTCAMALTKKQAKQDCAEEMRQQLQKKYNLRSTEFEVDNNTEKFIAPDLIVLEIDKLTLDTDPNVEASTEKAKKLFPELKKNVGVTIQDRKDISVNTFHSVFKNSLDSARLDQFHLFFKTLKFDSITNDVGTLRTILERICTILNLTFNKSILKTTPRHSKYAVAYVLNTIPVYQEIGVGDSISQADLQAVKRIIRTINLFLI